MRARRPPSDDAAVQSIMGEVVMVGAIVLLVAGISVVYFQSDPPPESTFSDIDVFVTCGADLEWGTGDERLVLVHNGGQAVGETPTVRYTIGVAVTRLEGAALGDPMQDGFTIGERWQRTVDVGAGDEVHAELLFVHEDGTGQVLVDEAVADRRCEIQVAPAVQDPGQAFEDIDGDCLYEAFTDSLIPDAQILDGQYTAPLGHGLVIPAGVGDIDLTGAGFDFRSGGGCLYIGVGLTTDATIALTSAGGPLSVVDGTSVAVGAISVSSAGGDITVQDATMRSTGAGVTIDADGGDIVAGGAGFTAETAMSIVSAAGAVGLTGADVESEAGDIIITAFSLASPDATIRAATDLDITTDGTMDLQRTTVRAETGDIMLDKSSNSNTLFIGDAIIEAPGDGDTADVRPSHQNGVVGSPASGILN